MAFDYESVGWEDTNSDRWEGKPNDISDTFGMFIHAYDDQSGEDHYFWVFSIYAQQNWDDWMDLIDSVMAGHGMELA